MNEPVPFEAALEAAVQAVSSAENATGRTALVNPDAGSLAALTANISEAPGINAPEATGVSAQEVASVSVATTRAPEATGIGVPEVASVNAPMAVATTSAPGKAQLSLSKAPKMEDVSVLVPCKGGATDPPANAVDTHFHLDSLARAVQRREEQGKSLLLAFVLMDVFQPSTLPIHAMNLQYAVALFCDLEFHVRLDRGPRWERLREICGTTPI